MGRVQSSFLTARKGRVELSLLVRWPQWYERPARGFQKTKSSREGSNENGRVDEVRRSRIKLVFFIRSEVKGFGEHENELLG